VIRKDNKDKEEENKHQKEEESQKNQHQKEDKTKFQGLDV